MIKGIIIAVLLFIIHSFFSFWGWIIIVPFVVGALSIKNPLRGFFISFLAGFLVWGGMALFLFLTKGEFIGARMAKVLYVNNPWLLVIATGLLGAFLAGLGGASGASLRKLFEKPKRSRYY